MDLLHLILLGIVQGLTEFLPVSSSAHLILLPQIAGWEDQGIAYDIAAHLGSLLAVIVYFHRDLTRIITATLKTIGGGDVTHDTLLFCYICIATVPVAVTGLIYYNLISVAFRDPLIIASATIFFGLILWWADYKGQRLRSMEKLGFSDVIWVGLAQVLSLIPGTSRSGITMTAGLILGLDRKSAARFSFLLAIPVILLAGGYEIYRFSLDSSATNISFFSTVLIVSAVCAWISIKFFLSLIDRIGMLPFVVYRLLLGIILIMIYS